MNYSRKHKKAAFTKHMQRLTGPRPTFRVFDTHTGTVVWSGEDRKAASANFESSVESFRKAGIRTYIILLGLDDKGIYRRMKERLII